MKPCEGSTDNGLSVLLAESDNGRITQLRKAFNRLPLLHRVSVVPDGKSALAYLGGEGEFSDRTEHPFPNIVFLNCRLPLLSGLGVLCSLRSEPSFEHLPVVLVSESFTSAQTEAAMRMRASCLMISEAQRDVTDAAARSIRLALQSDSRMQLHEAHVPMERGWRAA